MQLFKICILVRAVWPWFRVRVVWLIQHVKRSLYSLFNAWKAYHTLKYICQLIFMMNIHYSLILIGHAYEVNETQHFWAHVGQAAERRSLMKCLYSKFIIICQNTWYDGTEPTHQVLIISNQGYHLMCNLICGQAHSLHCMCDPQYTVKEAWTASLRSRARDVST